MADITINEISQNYTYNVGNNSYATVALPITSCWGPGFQDTTCKGLASDEELESIPWTSFPATQTGLESFVSTFRGPAAQYMMREDYSYQMAMTLLTSGYDVLVTRVATGKSAFGKFLFSNVDKKVTYAEQAQGTGLGSSKSIEYSTTAPYTVTTRTISKKDKEGKLVNGKEYLITTVTTYTPSASNVLSIKAKYLGSFGNNLRVQIRKLYRYSSNQKIPYWNTIVYVESSSGIRTAVENINFVFDVNNSTDAILHIDEVDSDFLTFDTTIIDSDEVELFGDLLEEIKEQNISTDLVPDVYTKDELSYASYNSITQIFEVTFREGSDEPATLYEDNQSAGVDVSTISSDAAVQKYLKGAQTISQNRYSLSAYNQVYVDESSTLLADFQYISKLQELVANPGNISKSKAKAILFREWMFTAGYSVYGCLEDKLAYNPNRIISPGWDDQEFSFLGVSGYVDIDDISPLHVRLMDLAYLSRCATAYIDIPKDISRAFMYNDSLESSETGYAQRLARYTPVSYQVSGSIYSTHSALFAPWGKYAYAGTSKQSIASPSFLALLIDRAMIKNQTSQYEWELPTSRKHSLRIGKMDYTISKKYLDEWQSLEGVGINCITQIPDLGLSIWGNSTLYEVPPATYQALANLSTRKLVNAIEDLAYKCGIGITFQYNNDQAYNAFYAGMTPLLDTMKNVGAIQDYYLRMAADINGLDQVNANSVVGKIYLIVNGVINDINVDLIALPPTSSLDEYKA